MLDIFQHELMRNALLAGLLTTIACGIIGSLVIVNRLVFITGGLPHAAYGGIGIAIFFGFSPSTWLPPRFAYGWIPRISGGISGGN